MAPFPGDVMWSHPSNHPTAIPGSHWKFSDFRFLMISPYFSSYFPSKDPWWRRPNWVDPVGRCHGTGTVRSLREHVNNLHRDPADDPIQRSNSPTWKIIFMDISICSCPLCTCVRIYVCIYILLWIYIYVSVSECLCVCLLKNVENVMGFMWFPRSSAL